MGGSVPRKTNKPIKLPKIVAVCTGGGFLDGYSLMIMNAALLLLVPQFHMSSLTEGITTALPFLGMAIGALIAGPLTDRYGRRIVFFVDIIIFLIISILLGLSQSLFLIGALRFILGMAIGADMPTSTSMLAEFSPQRLRGALTSFMNIAWLFGIFMAGVVGFILYETSGAGAWHWMFASAAIPALLIMIFRKDLPESPAWLRTYGRVKEAIAVEKLVPSAGENSQNVEKNTDNGGFLDIIRKGHWKLILFFAMYWVFNSLAGSPLLSYSSDIFHRIVKFDPAEALLLSAGLSGLYIIFSLIVEFTFLESHGRKTVALWTTAIAAIGAIISAFMLHNSLLLIISYTIAILAIQVGVLPIWPWSVEAVPAHIRATGQAIVTTGGKTGSFIGTLFLPMFMASVGWTVTFISMGGLFILSFLMVLIFGKETKDTTLGSLEISNKKDSSNI